MRQKWDASRRKSGLIRAGERTGLGERNGSFGDGGGSSMAGGVREIAGVMEVRGREQVGQSECDDKREGNEEEMHGQLQGRTGFR